MNLLPIFCESLSVYFLQNVHIVSWLYHTFYMRTLIFVINIYSIINLDAWVLSPWCSWFHSSALNWHRALKLIFKIGNIMINLWQKKLCVTQPRWFNWLAPGRCGCKLKLVTFNLISKIDILNISDKIVLWWLPQDLTDDQHWFR